MSPIRRAYRDQPDFDNRDEVPSRFHGVQGNAPGIYNDRQSSPRSSRRFPGQHRRSGTALSRGSTSSSRRRSASPSARWRCAPSPGRPGPRAGGWRPPPADPRGSEATAAPGTAEEEDYDRRPACCLLVVRWKRAGQTALPKRMAGGRAISATCNSMHNSLCHSDIELALSVSNLTLALAGHFP